jgi:hypothetical protein
VELRQILCLKWNGKIDQILSYVKNQEKESKVIKQMDELHKQEMAEMRMSTDALGLKFDRVKSFTFVLNTVFNKYQTCIYIKCNIEHILHN